MRNILKRKIALIFVSLYTVDCRLTICIVTLVSSRTYVLLVITNRVAQIATQNYQIFDSAFC